MTNASIQATPAAHDSYFAQPLSGSQGFYFSTLDQYQRHAELLKACGVEEFELQYIDGDNAELWAAADISQANIGEWLELLDTLEEYQEPALFFLMDHHGYTLAEAIPLVDDCMVWEGDAESYAVDLMDSTGELDKLPETLRYYFDYKALSRDMKLNGEIHEVTYDGTDYIMSGL
jgi:antirestriction protein